MFEKSGVDLRLAALRFGARIGLVVMLVLFGAVLQMDEVDDDAKGTEGQSQDETGKHTHLLWKSNLESASGSLREFQGWACVALG
jgi:hypothetical protein